jgi:type I restriction enzyme, S subunit
MTLRLRAGVLNPGRYVGVAAREEEDFDFKERLEELNEELEVLNVEARELEERIAENVVKLLELPRINWARASVSELCESIIDCVNKTAPTVEVPTPFRMIRTTNVRNGWVDTTTVKFVDEDTYKKWTRRGTPRTGDVILTREAPLGEAGLLRDDEGIFLGQRLVMYRTDPQKLDNRFLLYSFISDEVQGQIKSFGSGATVEHMRVPDCEKIQISLPPLPIQRKIASILSAYDDLIENNLRRIKILEEMAQNLYREWFVKFRFPGHEKVRFVDSPLGKIPEGWEVHTLGQHLDSLESGKRPKGGIVEGSFGVPSIGAENIIGIGKHRFQNEKYVSTEFYQGMRKGVVKDRDVALYKDGAYIGRSSYFRDGFPHSILCVNEHVFLIRTDKKRLTQNFQYLWLQDPTTVSAIKATNANAAQPGINQKGVKGLLIKLPSISVMKQFDTIIEPYLALIINLAKRNEVLRQTRDLLLPKLISGELDVSQIDINMPEEVEI